MTKKFNLPNFMTELINKEKLPKYLEQFRKECIQYGISLYSGNCANFAICLNYVLKASGYAIAFLNKKDYLENNPVHVAVVWNEVIWDSRGEMTKDDILSYARAFKLKYNKKGFVKYTNEIKPLYNILDDNRIKIIMDIMKNIFPVKE